MIKHVLIPLSLIFCLVAGASAQDIDPAKVKKSDQVGIEIQQLDLLNQLVPLALKKEQFNKILPVLERAREKLQKSYNIEADILAKLDSKLGDAIKAAVEKGEMPKKALVNEVYVSYKGMLISRSILAVENTEAVLKAFKETLNVGQLKVCANSLDPSMSNPTLKLDQMTDDDKIRYFVQNIILNPLCYDLLVKMERAAT